MRIFAILLKYLVQLIEKYTQDHHVYYNKSFLLMSGRKSTGDDGIIIGMSNDEVKSDRLFYKNSLAQYEIHHFIPTIYNQV